MDGGSTDPKGAHSLLTNKSSLQVVGGTGFIVSSWLFMLETQRKWYIPAPTVLGWHIGFWNLIGALGFTLCGAFGFASSNEVYESALTWSTFVGSWAFLVSQISIPSILGFIARHNFVFLQWKYLHFSRCAHPINGHEAKKGLKPPTGETIRSLARLSARRF